VGTRQRIIAYLAEAGELYDANGMASTQLAAAVGYPGSSVAFAQLLSGMERSGLIAREVRGKRTYRIGLGPARTTGPGINARAPGLAGLAGPPAGGSAGPGDAGVAGFDYDELARRLLVQVVRRLAATDAEASTPDGSATAEMPAAPDQPAPPDQLALQETVSGLEYELATAWTKHGKLAEENVRLREQLRAAQRSLALAAEQVRRPAAGGPTPESDGGTALVRPGVDPEDMLPAGAPPAPRPDVAVPRLSFTSRTPDCTASRMRDSRSEGRDDPAEDGHRPANHRTGPVPC